MRLFWVLRLWIYSIFMGSFNVLGYLGKPIFFKGFSKIYFGKDVRALSSAATFVFAWLPSSIFDNVAHLNERITQFSTIQGNREWWFYRSIFIFVFWFIYFVVICAGSLPSRNFK